MAITFGPGISIGGGGGFGVGIQPGNPVITGVVVAGTTATVSFTAPALNGHPAIQYYVVTSSPGNLVGTGSTSPITVSGLSTSTSYTFAITAYNPFGPTPSGSQNYLASSSSGNTLYAWGANSYGTLGLGSRTSYSSPRQVGALTNWSASSMALGGFNFGDFGIAAAIKTNGTLWTWGYNGSGALGLNNKTNYSSPVQVGALTTWSKLAVGSSSIQVIDNTGTLWACGANNYGQLGLNNATAYSTLRQVGSNTWSIISANTNEAVLGIDTSGRLWSWGAGTYGVNGRSTTASASSPSQIGVLTNWLSVSAGYTSVTAVKTDGTLWSWGANGNGGLGLNSQTSYYSSPKQVGALTNWKQSATGSNTAIAVKADGTLWSWGYNYYGQLGLGNTTNYSSPKQVGALTNWSRVIVGGGGAGWVAAIRTDGTLWTWGYNDAGELGLGSITNYSSPVQVGALTNWLGIAANHSQLLATQQNLTTAPQAPTIGTATATGSTTAAVSYTAPATGTSATSFTAVSTPGGITGTTSTSGSGSITVSGLTPSIPYTFQVYGSNAGGAGLWSSASNSVTPPVPSGSLWAWGFNNGPPRQLGLGSSTLYISSPTQLGAATNWINVNLSESAGFALKTDGTLWTWGTNTYGQLGLGNITNYETPQQLGALTNWASVSTSGYSTSAIKKDGTLWSWGYNVSGELGLGNRTNYSSPVQVGSLANWKIIFVQPATGGSLAIKTDGTLWAWGDNYAGQLGQGNTTNYSSPVQVGALTNWSTVSGSGEDNHVVAVKTDGTLWTWGANTYGQLGLGNITSYSSPRQVGALTNWKTPAAGFNFSSVIKTDGTLWTWGYHPVLGLGSSTNYSSPKQVGSSTNWSTIGSGDYHSVALKTDGTLWSWGYNLTGAIGLNGSPSTVVYPTQVGNLTTWIWASGFVPYESFGIHT